MKSVSTFAITIAAFSSSASGATHSYDPIGPKVQGTEPHPVITKTLRVDGVATDLVLDKLGNNGDQFKGEFFGDIRQLDGSPIYLTDFQERIYGNPDGQTVIYDKESGASWLVTHFEGPQPGQAQLTKIVRDDECRLTREKHVKANTSAVKGLWSPCAASLTPWNTHFGSEEYEPDARQWEEDMQSTDNEPDALEFEQNKIHQMIRAWGFCSKHNTCVNGDAPTKEDYENHFFPYNYGYPWELEITNFETGAHTVKKHYALGRLSRELSKISPDEKTVYSTDDGTNDAFYRFIAKNPREFGSGTLQCGKFETTNGAKQGGEFSVEWIDVATTEDAATDIAPKLETTKFSDLFVVGEYNATDASCSVGRPVQARSSKDVECLEFKDGMENLAGFLETRRACALHGGTTEFRKWEGITYDAASNTFYTAMTEINKGMMKNDTTYDIHTGDHIRVEAEFENKCGCIYKLPAVKTDDSDYDVQVMTPFVCGVYRPGTKDCDPNHVANPDGLHIVDGKNQLLVAEDTSNHEFDLIWAFDLDTAEGTIIANIPLGAEGAGLFIYPKLSADDKCHNVMFANQGPDIGASGIYAMTAKEPTDFQQTFPPNPESGPASGVNAVSALALGSIIALVVFAL